MSVYLLKNYGGFTASATIPVIFPDATEQALIAQGLAVAAGVTSTAAITPTPDVYSLQGGNLADIQNSGIGGTPASLQGPAIATNIALGSLALTSYETNGVAQTAGTFNFSEIYVPYANLWKGGGVLQGSTVGSTNVMCALWGTNGALLANSAVAGVITAGASTMLNISFTNPIFLLPGRYFLGFQVNSTGADTIRHVLSANGSNVMCGSVAGTFGTVPATITVPTTFTTAVAPICQLFTT